MVFQGLKRPLRGKGLDEGAEKSRRGFGSRVAALFARPRISDSDWEELEELLIAGDVGPDFATDAVKRLRERASKEGIRQPDELLGALRAMLVEALDTGDRTLASGGPPSVVLVVGVNGSGKTTTIAKLAAYLQSSGNTCVLAAADTFRAAAIDQLRVWSERLNARLVAHKPGADPAAVAFDAASAAVAAGADYLIVDTAGRLQTDRNLMAELDKVGRTLGKRIESAPHEVLLVMDALTGQNGLSQARVFCERAGVTGIALAKLDSSAKGGIAFAITRELGIPLKFAGTGEGLEDLVEFDPGVFVDALLKRGE